jgi:outer membrane protein assembly factor BamB
LKADDGELIWTYNAEGSWIISTVGIKDDVIYVGTSDSFLMLALDANSGREKFRFKANGYVFSSPAVVGHTAFFGDMTGKLFALDLKSDGKAWNEFSTEVRKKNAADILDKDDRLNFQVAAKGKDLLLYKTNVDVMEMFYTLGSIASSPVIQHQVIYFGSTDGYLYAINLKDEVLAGDHLHHH